MSEPMLKAVAGRQVLVGMATMALALVMAAGAWWIPGHAGYAGVGPNFLPWVVAGVLFVCGGLLAWQATHGGYRQMEAASGAERGDWKAVSWVVAGVLVNAALITSIGFVLSCALCFALAVRGLRQAEGRPGGSLRHALRDFGIGLAIAAPVFWLFRLLLAVNLPSLTGTSWI